MPPILGTGNPTTDYSHVVSEGTLIYQVPANLSPSHHVGITTFNNSSFEYQALVQWVSDGSLFGIGITDRALAEKGGLQGSGLNKRIF